jgi:hypothetical protein
MRDRGNISSISSRRQHPRERGRPFLPARVGEAPQRSHGEARVKRKV